MSQINASTREQRIAHTRAYRFDWRTTVDGCLAWAPRYGVWRAVIVHTTASRTHVMCEYDLVFNRTTRFRVPYSALRARKADLNCADKPAGGELPISIRNMVRSGEMQKALNV